MIGFYYPSSHMWSTLFLCFFRDMGIEIELIDESALDKLRHVKLLIVPGGFASEKIKSLNKKGLSILREYVKSGGIYVGICGGAGLGLSEGEKGIGLCPVKRKDMSIRVPNFSGHVDVELNFDASILKKSPYNKEIYIPVWWPSQFEVIDSNSVEVLATYLRPGSDLWITDIPYNILRHLNCSEVKDIYGINVDFELIKKDPCIIYGDYFKGKFLLSYSHLETPGSFDANRLFVHMLSFLLDFPLPYSKTKEMDIKNPEIKWDDEDLIYVKNSLLELVSRGEENFLLCWRKKWLLGWRRGVIGLCLNSLLCMCAFLLESTPSLRARKMWRNIKGDFLELFDIFFKNFEEYIVLQREFYLKNPHRAPDRFGSSPIHTKILDITGPFPGDGGLFKKLATLMEKMIYSTSIF